MGRATMLWFIEKPHRESPPSAMNIIERGKAFLQSLQALAARSAWDWQQCPACGSRLTIKNGSYTRRPWYFSGRQRVRVQRHLCHTCAKSYSEQSALLVRGSWYSREVRRSGTIG
jgi:transposase-like protein